MDEYINIGRWFSVLHRRSQIFVVEACEKLHLTYSEYVMLLRIYDHEGARQALSTRWSKPLTMVSTSAGAMSATR